MSEPKVKPFHALLWANYRETTMGCYLGDCERAFVRTCLEGTRQPLRVLDVACGSGALTLSMYDPEHTVWGIDLDALALGLFQQRSTAVPLTRGDAQQLPFADHSFDCVVAIQCVLYFDLHLFLRECNRVLANGGWLVLVQSAI
jgi:ubiquinone/menaquinone biosynthesis C-methylase UbiE